MQRSETLAHDGVMGSPLLSVIIVAYKSRDEIGACVGSLPRELVRAEGTRGAVETHASSIDFLSALRFAVNEERLRLVPPSPGDATATLGAVAPHLSHALQLKTA